MRHFDFRNIARQLTNQQRKVGGFEKQIPLKTAESTENLLGGTLKFLMIEGGGGGEGSYHISSGQGRI